MSRLIYLVSYDVSNDKRRRKLARKLEGVGRRVQESVFEIFATESAAKQIVSECGCWIVPREGDSLRAYRVCANCAGYAMQIGGTVIDWKRDIII